MIGMSKAHAENKAYPKRFYHLASLVEGKGAFSIALDGKELRTQAKNPLFISSRALADAIVAEWNAQQEVIHPDRMPLTRLINLTLDRTAFDRLAMIDSIVNYATTDLLCYRAPELSARQAAAFDPVLAWADREFGIRMQVTDGILPIEQPEASILRIRGLIEQANYAELTALAMMVPLLGSAILGLAVWKKHITIEQAMGVARIDETAQAEKWGVDEEAKKSWKNKQLDLFAAAFFLRHTMAT